MDLAKTLAAAAGAGDLDTMQAVLREYKALATGWKPLMDACYAGQAEAVALLLENGAAPNAQSRGPFYYRPLHRTVEYKKTAPKHEGHHQVVNLLLDAGADPMIPGSGSLISAIALCATGGATEFLPALLQRVPGHHDIFHASVLGEEARVHALLKEDPSLAKAHCDGTRIWTSDKGWTALMHCSSSRVGRDDEEKRKALVGIARTLLDHGADVTGCLDPALYTGNLEMVETLLKAGATPGDDDNLNHAACDGRFDALKLLLESGIRMDGTRGTEHHGGYTPLGCAVSCRSIKGAKWFLENGQDPNRIKSRDGENCLHVAVNFGAGDKMLQLLLEYGARIDQEDKQGRTPLARAGEEAQEGDCLPRGGRRKGLVPLSEWNFPWTRPPGPPAAYTHC